MRLRQWKAAIFLIMIALVSVGCSKPGVEYLGKWHNLKNNIDLEIVRNGDNFLVTRTRQNAVGKPFSNTLSCVLRDGILQSTGGLGTATLTYVRATDRLTTLGVFGGNVEYERVK